ncbi:UNVERIFIED_CONTAM: hypothetical protein DVV65_16080 [Lactiplantibacillus plantarum]|nr:hypothetical protein [Lactiplantibacillus plantarum]
MVLGKNFILGLKKRGKRPNYSGPGSFRGGHFSGKTKQNFDKTKRGRKKGMGVRVFWKRSG